MKKRNRFGIFTLVLILSLCGCTQDKIPISSSSDVQKEQDTLPEAEITPEEEPFLYGYQNLNEEEKTRYRQILAGIENYEDSVTVEACSEEEINRISNLVFVDHPEIFWLEQQNYSFNQKENSDVDLLELNLVYNMGKDEIEDTKQQIEAKAEEWSQELSNCENEYDKIKYVQRSCIWMTRISKKLLRWCHLNQFPVFHYTNCITQKPHHRQIMGNKQK